MSSGQPDHCPRVAELQNGNNEVKKKFGLSGSANVKLKYDIILLI